MQRASVCTLYIPTGWQASSISFRTESSNWGHGDCRECVVSLAQLVATNWHFEVYKNWIHNRFKNEEVFSFNSPFNENQWSMKSIPVQCDDELGNDDISGLSSAIVLTFNFQLELKSSSSSSVEKMMQKTNFWFVVWLPACSQFFGKEVHLNVCVAAGNTWHCVYHMWMMTFFVWVDMHPCSIITLCILLGKDLINCPPMSG